MKKFLKIKNVLLFLAVISFVSGSSLFFPKVAEAGIETIPNAVDECRIHGHNDTLFCGVVTDFYGAHDYTLVQLQMNFYGHRHGSSAINTSMCITNQYFDEGVCKAFVCSGNSCGVEYGGEHPWNLLAAYPFVEYTPSTPGPFLVRKGGYVTDAEYRAEHSGYAYWANPPPPPAGGIIFHVGANCSGENIENAEVTLNGSQVKYTDSGGYVQFTSAPNTGFSYNAAAFGYNQTNGSGTTNGSGDTSVDVTLARDCAGEPPPPPPPPPPDPPPPGCTAYDGAVVTFTQPPPSSVAPGQVVPFKIKANNSGNTQWWLWYSASGYRLIQFTNQNIYSVAPSEPGYPYGRISWRAWPGDDTEWDFNLTAPSTPGDYSISMQMIHEGLVDAGLDMWAYRLWDASNGGCAIPPETFTFGNMATANFTVVAPTITSAAAINTTSVTPDNTTQYVIGVAGTDTGGQDRIYNLYGLINYQGTNAGQYRGYLIWTAAYPGAGFQDLQACSGSSSGGYGLIINGQGYGEQYMHLDGCTITDLPGNTKTANFVVRFTPQFGTDGPLTNNDISSNAHDGPLNMLAGWTNNDLNFSITQAPTVTYGCGAPSPGSPTCTATYGGTVPLYWSSTNATSCTLDGAPVAVTSSATSGVITSTVTSTFQCTGPGGTAQSSVTINAGGCSTNCAQYISHKINGVLNPTSITLYSGQAYSAEVTMKNTGTNAWTGSGNPKYRLGPKSLTNTSSSVVNVPGGGVAANTPRTFDTSFTAGAVGTYTYKWQMLSTVSSSNVISPPSPAFFGDVTPDVTVNVVPPPPAPPATVSSSCNAVGDEVTLTWSAVPWATDYILRVDNTVGNQPDPICASGWYCADPPDKLVDYYGSTSYTMDVVPNQTYVWWVHANNSTGYSAPTSGTFNCPDIFRVTVSSNPGPGGSVKSTDNLINCGSQCSADYTKNSVVTLQGTPSSSYWKFDHWTGDCTGVNPICALLVDSDKNATAIFTLRQFDYTEF